MKLKYLIILMCLWIGCITASAQTDTISVKDISANTEVYYPSGLNLTIGTMINNKFNYHYKASYLWGNGKSKGGFTFGFNSFNYKDTGKADPVVYKLINSLGIGVTARTYANDAHAYFTVSALYLIAVSDNRFGATNGMGMSAGLGFCPNKSFFFELGMTGASFLTLTMERPSSWGVMINIGVNL